MNYANHPFKLLNAVASLSVATISILIFASCMEPPEPLSNDWSIHSQRSEIEPKYWVDGNVLFENEPTLALSGNGKAYVNGSWTKTYSVDSNKVYKFVTHFKPQKVVQLNRSILAQITWLNKQGKRVGFKEFPADRAKQSEGEWYIIEQSYEVPDNVEKAKIDLFYRWDANGTVYFGGTQFDETNAIEPRLVRLAAIHHRPKNTSSILENLEQFKTYINIAGEQKADIVCLPEGITIVGNGKTYVEASESIPGPTTDFLGELAKNNNMYIVAGLIEKDGLVIYNTSVLIGRDGTVEGKYRKTSLPREEVDGGITPGEYFPVFNTDFGKVGMMICWDVYFPEPARMLALNGAEVIFMPIWGGNLTLAKARAIENQIYLVSSTYDMKTGVFDKTGKLIAEGTDENPVVVIEVDLNKRELWNWLGEFKNRIQREMPSVSAISY